MSDSTNLQENHRRGESSSEPVAATFGKRPYSPPRLVSYGDFHRLTRSVDGGGSSIEESSLGVHTST